MRQTLLLLLGFTALQFIFLTGGGYLLWFRAAKMSIRRASLKALLMLLGGAIIIVGVILMAGGAYLLRFNAAAQNDDDYLTTGVLHYANRRAFAIAASPADVEIDLFGRLSRRLSYRWFDLPRFAAQKLKGSNSISVVGNNPSNEIFIGIAKESDVEAYLADVTHVSLTRLDLNPFDDHRTGFNPDRRSGKSEPPPPASLSIWEKSTHGTGYQTFMWASSPGSRVVVIMNEDGSPGIDVDLTLGARVPLVFRLGLVALIGSIIVIVGGAATSYSAVRV